MTPPPTLPELIATIQQDSPSDDPLDLLATASTTVAELSNTGDTVLDHYVLNARSQGRSWAEISSVLGVSKQAAHKRFSPSKQGDVSVTFNLGDLSRFTDRARRTVAAAQQIAGSWGHNYVGTEHLLVAQYTEPDAIAAKVLADHGVTREQVEQKVHEVTPPGDPITDGRHLMFTPRSHKVLEDALREALTLGHNYIGTEHLLLGLLASDGLAAKALHDLGLSAKEAKADIIAALSKFQKPRD